MAITTDKAFDMLPLVMDIYDKLEIKAHVSELQQGKGIVDKAEIGISAVGHIIRNIGKVKDEVCEVVAIIDDKTPAEVKAQPLSSTIKALRSVLVDAEMISFFKSAM